MHVFQKGSRYLNDSGSRSRACNQNGQKNAGLLGRSLHKNVWSGCTGILLGRSESGQKGENQKGYGQIGRQDQASILLKAVTLYPHDVPDDGIVKKKSSGRFACRDTLLAGERLAGRSRAVEEL